MLIHTGTQEKLVAETTVGAGTTTIDGSITSDSLLASLWVSAITGTLSVSCYTETAPGKQELLFSFTPVTGVSTDLVTKKAGVSLQRFRFVITYTGVTSYEIYVRAIQGIGESSTRLLGSSNWVVSQISVPTSATLLIPSAETDRVGLIVRNWNTSGTLYIAEASGTCTTGNGYPIAAQESLAIDLGAGAAVYGIASTGSIDCRIAQAGG